MKIISNEPLLSKQPNVKLLLSFLDENQDKLQLTDSVVYHNLLLSADSENIIRRADITIVSRNHGIIIFRCLDDQLISTTESEYPIDKIIDDFEQIYSLMFSKLLKVPDLRENPVKLKIDIYPILFFSDLEIDEESIKGRWSQLEFVKGLAILEKLLENKILKEVLYDELFNETLSVLEGANVLTKKKEKIVSKKEKLTKGNILKRIEGEIATFDLDQKRAALIILDGAQRIRGLAGSGKTIVLAMKAAQILLSQPNAKILYTYWTKQLYDFIKDLITRFYRQVAGEDPDWDQIDIMHAWGGQNLEGVYYNACIDNNVQPLKLRDVRSYGKNAFNEACKDLCRHSLKESYDYSFLDEAQDFPLYFYRLCRRITKNNRVIWGYDECQNILNMDIQDTVQTFGKNSRGHPYIDFTKTTIKGQDIVLHKCYRNPGSSLITAFGLGLGIYNDKIIQLPESIEHWEDLGFQVIKGDYKKDSQMEIIRPEENTLHLKNELLDKPNNAVKWKTFDKFNEECEFVANCIVNDLNDELEHEDIIVISLDDRAARNYFIKISSLLMEKDIKTFNLLEAPSFNTAFRKDNHITLTTVYRAKGNEAGSVYIVGVDKIFESKDSVIERNKLFTAITRSKAWVTVTGMGEETKYFEREIKKIIKNDYKLIFKMPDRTELKMLQRDLAKKQAEINKLTRVIDSTAGKLGMNREELIKQIFEKGRVNNK